jgi:cell volume regulation protein A
LLAGLDFAWLYFNVAFFVVLVSLIVQGWTVAPLARWLGLQLPASASAVQRVNLDVPGQYEQEFVGYRVTPQTAAIGEMPTHLHLPDDVRLLTVIRDGKSMAPEQVTALAQDDFVYLLTPGATVAELDRLFATRAQRADLDEHLFYGDFVLNGDAHLGDIGAMYGFPVDAEVASRTLGEHLQRVFRARPVVGDRSRIGSVELVVREMQGRVISKVGLRFVSAD